MGAFPTSRCRASYRRTFEGAREGANSTAEPGGALTTQAIASSIVDERASPVLRLSRSFATLLLSARGSAKLEPLERATDSEMAQELQ